MVPNHAQHSFSTATSLLPFRTFHDSMGHAHKNATTLGLFFPIGISLGSYAIHSCERAVAVGRMAAARLFSHFSPPESIQEREQKKSTRAVRQGLFPTLGWPYLLDWRY